MAEITARTAPPDVPTTNALDKIKLSTGRGELRLGQNVLMALDTPPILSETIDVVLRLRCVRSGEEQLAPDSDVTHYCAMKIVTAWLRSEPEPVEQPAMVDGDGKVIADPDANSDPDASDEGPL